MRMEFAHQEFFYIIFRRLLRKFGGKRNYYQVVDAPLVQQLNFFFDSIDQVDRLVGSHHLTGMRMESNDHRLAANPGGLLFQLLQYELVAQVNAIKSADRDHSLAKNRQII